MYIYIKSIQKKKILCGLYHIFTKLSRKLKILTQNDKNVEKKVTNNKNVGSFKL